MAPPNPLVASLFINFTFPDRVKLEFTENTAPPESPELLLNVASPWIRTNEFCCIKIAPPNTVTPTLLTGCTDVCPFSVKLLMAMKCTLVCEMDIALPPNNPD